MRASSISYGINPDLFDDCIQIYKGVYDNHKRARETFQKSPQRQDSLKA